MWLLFCFKKSNTYSYVSRKWIRSNFQKYNQHVYLLLLFPVIVKTSVASIKGSTFRSILLTIAIISPLSDCLRYIPRVKWSVVYGGHWPHTWSVVGRSVFYPNHGSSIPCPLLPSPRSPESLHCLSSSQSLAWILPVI